MNTPLFAANTTLAQSAMTRTVAAGDTFASLAAFFGTDPGSVALAARLVPGVVAKDQTLTVDGTQYPVKEGDTLTAIAAGLSQAAGHTISVQAVAAAPGVVDEPAVLATNAVVHCFSPANLVAPRRRADRDRRHAHVAPDVLTLLAGITIAPAGAGLLRPGIRVALGRVATTPSSSDSSAGLAAYFEDDPGSFAVANQDRQAVLAGGTELKLGTHTYKVGDDDTLVDVANGLGTTTRELAVAPGIGDRAGIFNASPVYDLQVLPEFPLSTAKTPLADGTSHVAFLFGTNADASFKSLFLDVGYDVAEIETDIRNIQGAGDYQASEWLRLVVPLGASAFGGAVDLTAGQTQVPIPLRAFPLLPAVVDLAAEAAWPKPTTIADAKQWELMAAVQHQSAAQDELQLEVTFGSAPSLGNGDGAPALFDALAQFVTAGARDADRRRGAGRDAGRRHDGQDAVARREPGDDRRRPRDRDDAASAATGA